MQMCRVWKRKKDLLSASGKRFPIKDMKKIVDDLCCHCNIDSKEEFGKAFFEEYRPIVLIGECIEEVIDVKFTGKNCSYDGSFTLKTLEGNIEQKIEMTAAIDGHNEVLAEELVAVAGSAPADQKINASGTMHNRKFGKNETIFSEVKLHINEKLLPLIKRAICKKVKKAETNKSYINAWLGITFHARFVVNDYIKDDYELLLRDFMDTIQPEIYEIFPRIFLLGNPSCMNPSRRLFIDSETYNKCIKQNREAS